MAGLLNAEEVYRVAIRIEQNGATFYATAARNTQNPENRTMYEDLAGWERGHEKLLTDLHRKLDIQARSKPIHDPQGELQKYLDSLAANHVFRNDTGLLAVLEGLPGPAEVLRMAIRLELEAHAFYGLLKKAVPEYMGLATLDRLIAEERDHANSLKGKLFALTGQA